ncbi:GntR family transcriptional regulator [Croceitalea rosinachiae]|uniref:GntR family transcriptional regulator n=1 Tax=Croceitalea rosinachiae TaxID=3075596 RepID=A0ABU3A633_9FLAO|nr:GntR family transcriptional regulator [Croceitalea sp. F388]MDT0605631.1 GntR family transcriptional regulator [Croceitalea sp. F388]
MKLIGFIKKLEEINSLSKHEQLVLGVIEAIDSGHLKMGDQMPSINTMVEEVGFARKTIVKAYEELKDRGLVVSKKTKGYFIVSNKTKVFLKIALLMYSFQRFQQEFYNSLRNEIGDRVQIDVFFHHNNEEVFETIFSNIHGKYGMYVVAPIESSRTKALLRTLSPERLLIVDRFLDLSSDYTYVTQEFEESTYKTLVQLLPKIKNYRKLKLYFRNDMDYPIGILNSYQKFLKDYNIQGEVHRNYKDGDIEKGTLFLFIGDADLWSLLKACKVSNYSLGQDIGVLSFNDHVVKEIILGGITTISTDFKQMASLTANNLKNLTYTKSIVPTTLIDRDSL